MTRRRVVITGVGALCSIGEDAASTWEAAKAGRSGAARVTRFDASRLSCQIACEVKNHDSEARFGRDARKLDLFTQYAVITADEAVSDSGLDFTAETPERCGVIVGSGIGGLTGIEHQYRILLEKGPRRVSPHFIPKIMINSMAGQISIRHRLRGHNYITASACASSSHAMGLALHAIRDGFQDIVVTGGSESTITELAMAGFANMRAMSTRNDDPEGASRPFDKNRDGFVMGEGAAMLIFEELEHAKARGARIYAEVKGFGLSSDAYHITAPSPDGYGPTQGMNLALKDGGVGPERINYINAHGTSTVLNDSTESRAIRTVFGDHADRIAVSSSKSMLGHVLGASGAVELVLCAKSIESGIVHPTINYETRDPECDLDFVPNEARELAVDHVLSNSLGFGGHNVTLCIGRFDG